MVSYLITVCNEYRELDKLLKVLTNKVSTSDEIIILRDIGNTNGKVSEVIKKYVECDKCDNKIDILEYSYVFSKDFSYFKNLGNSHCNKEWIFQIDADEYPSDLLLDSLHYILLNNDKCDLIYVPRINTVDGLLQKDVLNYHWQLSKDMTELRTKTFNKGDSELLFLESIDVIKEKSEYQNTITATYYIPLVNYPDYQSRLYKNKENINWVGVVHETIEGASISSKIPMNLQMNLYHHKDIERQRKQNELYKML